MSSPPQEQANSERDGLPVTAENRTGVPRIPASGPHSQSSERRPASDGWRACAPRNFRPPPRPARRGALTEPPLPRAHAQARAQRLRSAGFFPAAASWCSRSSSRSPPPPARRGLVSTCGPARGALCASCSRDGGGVLGSSHGDGASERAVRGASESGDGHDGPQLHPALPAGSPQGSWSPGAQGLPRDPYPRVPLRPFQTHLSPASAALGPPTPRGDSGFWSCGPPHLFPLGSSLACAPVFALNSRVANCRAFSSHFSVAFLPTPHVFSL